MGFLVVSQNFCVVLLSGRQPQSFCVEIYGEIRIIVYVGFRRIILLEHFKYRSNTIAPAEVFIRDYFPYKQPDMSRNSND